MDDRPDCSYEDIVEHFGEPKDIVVEYIKNSDENYLIQRMRLKEVFQKFIVSLYPLYITCDMVWSSFGMMSIEIQIFRCRRNKIYNNRSVKRVSRYYVTWLFESLNTSSFVIPIYIQSLK